MVQFTESEAEIAGLKSYGEDPPHAVPAERLTTPAQLRNMDKKMADDDETGSFNRMLVQQMMDFTPPHDDVELRNKGQDSRFNFPTGEGTAIKNEAVGGYMDVYTTPKTLAEIPLLAEVDEAMSYTWANIMAEEFTTMDRSDDVSLPRHLQLCDIYVTHGVAIGFFDDKRTMRLSVAGLDHFHFPRKSGIVTSEIELATATGYMSLTDLHQKIDGLEDGEKSGWNPDAVQRAILQSAKNANSTEWTNWEIVQREIKANDLYISTICDPVKVVYGWVKEFNGKISFYIATAEPLDGPDGYKEQFLYSERNMYDSPDEAFQLFCFSVGNGGRLYTVRGFGYLIFQICNALDIMYNKMLDNARIGSSLILQAASSEDMQDTQLTDFGDGVMIPPTAKVIERPVGQNLNNTLLPAIEASRAMLNRSTGGLASGNLLMDDKNDRKTNLEMSTKLDYINRLNGFASMLFYGPYDKVIREKVRRAFTVLQSDDLAKKRVEDMKQRCIDRGVPEEMFGKIDYKRVRATRIIGTGSRASRIMLMDQIQQMYSTWSAVGRKNFEYDYLVELIGVDKAERYAGKPNEKRVPYDFKIAQLENFQLVEGDYMDPQDGENHMVHLPVHIEEMEVDLAAIDQGEIDLVEWTKEHIQLFRHTVATIEMTTVHESMQAELNSLRQRTQQIGEIANNGMKALNKQAREEGEAVAEAGQEGQVDPKAAEASLKMQQSQEAHKLKLQQEMESHMLRLEMTKTAGQQQMVLAAQKAMSEIANKSAEVQAKLKEFKAKNI